MNVRAWLMLGALWSLAIGCSGSTAPAAPFYAGEWALVSVNGQPLPYTLSAVPPAFVVTADTLSAANGVIFENATYRIGATQSLSVVSGNVLILSATQATYHLNSSSLGNPIVLSAVGTLELRGSTLRDSSFTTGRVSVFQRQ